MRVLVCGGRTFTDRALLDATLDQVGATQIIEGGAPGADEMARQWATKHGIPCVTAPADWPKFGLAAGPIRNQRMLDLGPDLVIAFRGGRGTADMVKRAQKAGVKVREIPVSASVEGER